MALQITEFTEGGASFAQSATLAVLPSTKNIADMYLTDSDAARWLFYYDYLMFVLMCAEDLENESMAKNRFRNAPSHE